MCMMMVVDDIVFDVFNVISKVSNCGVHFQSSDIDVERHIQSCSKVLSADIMDID